LGARSRASAGAVVGADGLPSAPVNVFLPGPAVCCPSAVPTLVPTLLPVPGALLLVTTGHSLRAAMAARGHTVRPPGPPAPGRLTRLQVVCTCDRPAGDTDTTGGHARLPPQSDRHREPYRPALGGGPPRQRPRLSPRHDRAYSSAR